MSSSDTRQTLARQWELLKLLPSSGAGKSAKELTEQLNDAGYAVSKRQVERDLTDLLTVFPIHRNDAGMPYGWRWADKPCDLPSMTVAEALSTKLLEDSIRTLVPPVIMKTMEPRFQLAARKLEAIEKGNSAARWIHKVRAVPPGMTMLAPQVAANVLEAVQEALLCDEQVEVEYLSANGGPVRSLTLHPLALVSRGPVAYLIATANAYTDVRRYALHRFTYAKRNYLPSNRAIDFNLELYLDEGGMQFGNGAQVSLEAWVSPTLAGLLAESPLSDDQTLTPANNGMHVTATVRDSWQLQWWLLGEGEDIEVIGPPELRKKIGDAHRQAASRY